MNDSTFKDYILDQLDGLPGVRAKAMFGGFGLYRADKFFACIIRERLYFKTDDESRKEYEAEGMKPFRYNAKMTLKTYFEVPAGVMDDPDLLVDWARRALEAASKKEKKGKKR